jgi:hypothetical protein
MASGGVSGRRHRLADARALARGQRADHALLRRRDQEEHEYQRAALRRESMPLEALVERQPLRRPTNEGSLRLAVESGMHSCACSTRKPMSTSYRADFLTLYALLPPTDAERAAAMRDACRTGS